MVSKQDHRKVDYSARLERLREVLSHLPCDALVIAHPIHLLYLTGLELSAGKLLISLQQAALIVDGRYREISARQTLYPVHLLKEGALQGLIAEFKVKKLAFEQHETSYHDYLNLKQQAEEVIPVESPVRQLRLIKDEMEIALLQESAQLARQGYQHVLSLLREDVSEAEIAFELEFFWKKRGASRLAFDAIIAFGANSSMPHYRAGKTRLQKGMAVLIDIGVVLNHYHSDMTRMHFFGIPDPKIQEITSIVAEAKERALGLCRPGTLIGELDHVAREWIASKGYGEYFTHSLGHGVGLEIHEPPIIRSQSSTSNIPLQKGMVITIEPGIYLPQRGGARLEDTICITETGYINLTGEN